MTLNEYERKGGFSDELRAVRTIGQTITLAQAEFESKRARRAAAGTATAGSMSSRCGAGWRTSRG